MELVIVRIDQNIFDGKFKKILLPTESGEVEILPGHTPYLASLRKGVLKYIDSDDKLQKLEIGGGFVEVNKNKVIVIL